MTTTEQKHIEQVGRLVLEDDGEICVVASPLTRQPDSPDMLFTIRNKKKNRRYRVRITIIES